MKHNNVACGLDHFQFADLFQTGYARKTIWSDIDQFQLEYVLAGVMF